MLNDGDSLWGRVLRSKYGEGVRVSEGNSWRKGSRWWKDLGKVGVCQDKGEWFSGNVQRVVGDGKLVSFWDECWVGDVKLKQKFKRLFELSEQRDSVVGGVGEWEGERWNWKFRWRRDLFEREKQLLEVFMQEISAVQILKDKQDGWSWAGDLATGYTVKSAYLAQLPISNDSAFFKTIWRSMVPSKVIGLAWKIAHGRLPTLDNLLKRGVDLGDNNDGQCFFCSQHIEEVAHLFFSCDFTYKVWMGCYEWLSVETVLHKAYDTNFFHHEHWGKNKKQRLAWRSIWLAVLWCIWDQRNAAVFSGEQVRLEKVVDMIKLTSWLWLKSIMQGFCASFYAWDKEPWVCLSGL